MLNLQLLPCSTHPERHQDPFVFHRDYAILPFIPVLLHVVLVLGVDVPLEQAANMAVYRLPVIRQSGRSKPSFGLTLFLQVLVGATLVHLGVEVIH